MKQAAPRSSIPPPSESVEQINLFRWSEFMYRKYPELEYLHHIPNGGMRSRATAGRLKAEGVKSGVPDICLPVPCGGYHGLYIELKRVSGNTASANQNKWIAFLNKKGYLAVVCHGWEAASKLIIDYLGRDVDEI